MVYMGEESVRRECESLVQMLGKDIEERKGNYFRLHGSISLICTNF